MKKTISLLVLYVLVSCQAHHRNVVGKYYTAQKNIKSMLELKNDGRFLYTFERDSFCNGEITGKYKLDKQVVKFENDYEYSAAFHQEIIDSLSATTTATFDIAFRDFDMGLVDWKISGNGIKPTKKIETPCFEFKNKHFKNRRP